MTAPVTSPIDGRVDQHVFLVFFGLLVLLRPDGTPPGVLRSMVRAAAWVIDGIALIRHPRFPGPGALTTRSG